MTLLLASSLALALVAADEPEVDPLHQPDPSGHGYLVASTESHRVVFWPDDKRMAAKSYGEFDVEYSHEADPYPLMDVSDAIGRRVDFAPPRHFLDERGEAQTRRGRVIVLGGIPPARYREAEARAGSFVGPPRPEPLVSVWMAHRSYAIREAATAILVRRGEAAIPALLAGLRNPDLEVRDRCAMALDAIRVGPSD